MFGKCDLILQFCCVAGDQPVMPVEQLSDTAVVESVLKGNIIPPEVICFVLYLLIVK